MDSAEIAILKQQHEEEIAKIREENEKAIRDRDEIIEKQRAELEELKRQISGIANDHTQKVKTGVKRTCPLPSTAFSSSEGHVVDSSPSSEMSPPAKKKKPAAPTKKLAILTVLLFYRVLLNPQLFDFLAQARHLLVSKQLLLSLKPICSLRRPTVHPVQAGNCPRKTLCGLKRYAATYANKETWNITFRIVFVINRPNVEPKLVRSTSRQHRKLLVKANEILEQPNKMRTMDFSKVTESMEAQVPSEKYLEDSNSRTICAFQKIDGVRSGVRELQQKKLGHHRLSRYSSIMPANQGQVCGTLLNSYFAYMGSIGFHNKEMTTYSTFTQPIRFFMANLDLKIGKEQGRNDFGLLYCCQRVQTGKYSSTDRPVWAVMMNWA
ncbi:hypothetical protein CAEBREN_02626 [Caenorhabditis brenneri]|uniref:Uncharacterized protein n=1 Tax=Caenorhabditis brenneri TaxID=135651 RepID=G0N7I9_CAEBE|nr:hypothetical protein CAEBREN_02626 [Caenorhabditis brenneri]